MSAAGHILVVDDDPRMLATIDRALRRSGHTVATCASVEDGVATLAGATFDLVITDLRMPTGTGLDLLAHVQAHSPDTRTILISGDADAADAAAAIEKGVSRLLLKPFGVPELRAAVAAEIDRARTHVATKVDQDEALARERARESQTWILRAACALAAAVEAKDTYTAGHTTRVCDYVAVLADAMDFTDIEGLRLASNLHDVGKIGVPDAILNKPDRLDADEYEQVRRHAAAGERILQPLLDDPLVLGVARSHHERWDGAGYPDGLAGDAIPLGARIVAVADVLDAMTSTRAYRDGMSWADAIDEIRRCTGTQFDPAVAAALESRLPELHAVFQQSRRQPT